MEYIKPLLYKFDARCFRFFYSSHNFPVLRATARGNFGGEATWEQLEKYLWFVSSLWGRLGRWYLYLYTNTFSALNQRFPELGHGASYSWTCRSPFCLSGCDRGVRLDNLKSRDIYRVPCLRTASFRDHPHPPHNSIASQCLGRWALHLGSDSWRNPSEIYRYNV